MNFSGLEKRAHYIIGCARQSGKNVLEMTDCEWLEYRNVGNTTLDAIKRVVELMRKEHYMALEKNDKTLRDEFAMAAIVGIGANDIRRPEPCNYEVWASNAYRFADAMLKAREVKP